MANQAELEITKEKEKQKEPPMWEVLLHNDDDTPMDFVVMVLEKIFHHGNEQAIEIMLAIHNEGIGVAGCYTKDIAETKKHMTDEVSRVNGFPLKCTIRKEGDYLC